MNIKTFETGKTYSTRSIGDHECTWDYKVLKRTEKTVTITDGKVTKTCRINKAATEYSGIETVYPLGQYSMAPCLRAG